MLLEWLTPALLVLVVLLSLWLVFRRTDAAPMRALRDELHHAIRADVHQLERELRDEVARSAGGTRQELTQGLADFQRTLLAQQGGAREAQEASLGRSASQQADTLQRLSETLNDQLRALSRSNDQRMNEMRAAVELKLAAIQADNEKKLEQIRGTVDEKLHATLEQRLGESFRQVAERLEQVHRGIGEMQKLASDVGSLSRVLSNVKTRGTFGEVQLGALLEQVFAPAQYAKNVETIPNSNQRVDYAIRFPGRGGGETVWMPIDCKFPREDYERLVEAHERADAAGVELSAKAIEARLRIEARTIRDKYLAPPHTTDFAILFVPTEGLYAEALRRPGLFESLQRDHRVTLAGPTTLLAILTSFRVGFNTLALEQRSNEVRDVLGAVKTEFGKFGSVLARTRKKLDEASNTIGEAEKRTRVMGRALKDVEAMPEERAAELLPSTGELDFDDPVDG